MDNLYYGLPAIYNGSYWIVYSPANGNIAQLSEKEFQDPETYHALQNQEFFKPDLVNDDIFFQITLIVTGDCNLRCKYCFANGGDISTQMTQEIAIAGINHALSKSRDKRLSVSFFGGEPTLNQTLIKKIVAYTELKKAQLPNKDLTWGITTNGVFDHNFIGYLAEKEFLVTLSMDGIPEVQDFQRPTLIGNPTSNIVKKTIVDLIAAGVDLTIRATVTDFSVAKMPETVNYLSDIGVKKIHFEAINPAGRAEGLKTKGDPLARPSANDFIKYLTRSIEVATQLDMEIQNSSFMNLRRPSLCFCDGMSGVRLALGYDGAISKCLEVQNACHPFARDYFLGQYNPEKNALEIKKSNGNCCSSFKQPIECENCFAKLICGGGCPVRNQHITGDLGKPDPFHCEVVKNMLIYIITQMNNAC